MVVGKMGRMHTPNRVWSHLGRTLALGAASPNGYTREKEMAMTTFRTLRLMLILTLFCCSLEAEAKEPMTTIEVVARLTKIPGKFPADDLYDYAYVMEYQVEGGAMDKQTLLVAHYKPRRARQEIDDAMKKFVGGGLKRFDVGALHRLTLTANMRQVWKGAVVDEFFDADRKSKRYFCLKADPAESK
jgi:hypothetical protein